LTCSLPIHTRLVDDQQRNFGGGARQAVVVVSAARAPTVGGADHPVRASLGRVVLYNPAKMRVERYRYRGEQIATPFNIDVIDPAGARFRRTGHDDVELVGQVSELIT
jgi:hypothetical protein